MAVITIFHIFFRRNIILPDLVHVTLFISYHLATSSVIGLLKSEALWGSQLRGQRNLQSTDTTEDSLQGQPHWIDICLVTYIHTKPTAAGLQTSS